MKNLFKISGLLLLVFFVLACSSCNSKNVDICRCLTEPGNSEWNQINKTACDEAISKEIGVENWLTVNMSQNPSVSEKFDELARSCR